MDTLVVTREDLVTTLKVAAELKGATPISSDADKRLFGLQGKARYLREFGSWNGALKAAGLPVNRRRRSVKAKLSKPVVEVRPHGSLEAFIVERIYADELELRVLRGVLDEFQK